MSSDNRIHARAGFSLIEVLIAVLVLAIGMLGLGAVFPAIIAEQRESFAAIEGQNAAAAAEALLSNPEMVDFSYISQDFNRPIRGGLQSATMPPRFSYEWVVPQDGQTYYGWRSPMPGFNFFNGLWSYNINDSSVNDVIDVVNMNPYLGQIPLSSRLYPQPYSGKEPKLVWDVALRREPSGDRLQAAIFVRRIDARIRVPQDHSLSDVLTGNGGISANQVRLPVAINPDTGLPVADDGNNRVYAAIQMLEVEVFDDHLDWLVIKDDQPIGRDNADTSVDLATKVGQKLVDNTGVVRTVVGTADVSDMDLAFGRGRIVQVDPPFLAVNAGNERTGNARSNTGVTNSDPEWDDERASWVRQVIFTPREPIAVRVVTLEGGS
ncbi:MAG: type IV pilus modification PilV family protein [Phycisphaerales bacterium]